MVEKWRDRKCNLYRFTFMFLIDLKKKKSNKLEKKRDEPKKKIIWKNKWMKTDKKKKYEV